jgi:hypothetical protein
MAIDVDELVVWIDALHGRVARGELKGWGACRVGVDALAVERAARVLLADVDHDRNLTLDRRRDPFNVERRRQLLAELRQLRAQIG